MDTIPVISPLTCQYYIPPPINHRLSPYTGLTKDLAAQSCKEIKQQLSDNCNEPPTSKAYWIKYYKQPKEVC